MVIVLAADVEAVGMDELVWIAIGGAEQEDGLVATGQGGAVDIDVVEGDAGGELYGRVVAEDLLDGGSSERGILSQAPELVGVATKGQHAVADEVDRGLV